MSSTAVEDLGIWQALSWPQIPSYAKVSWSRVGGRLPESEKVSWNLATQRKNEPSTPESLNQSDWKRKRTKGVATQVDQSESRSQPKIETIYSSTWPCAVYNRWFTGMQESSSYLAAENRVVTITLYSISFSFSGNTKKLFVSSRLQYFWKRQQTW